MNRIILIAAVLVLFGVLAYPLAQEFVNRIEEDEVRVQVLWAYPGSGHEMEDDPEDYLIRYLNGLAQSADGNTHELSLALLTLTDDDLSNAILAAHRTLGVHFRILVEGNNDCAQGSDITYLHSQGIEVRVDTASGLMHHKILIDRDLDETRYTVITGSYNWSDAADTRNYENLIVISGPYNNIYADYSENYARMWEDSVPFQGCN